MGAAFAQPAIGHGELGLGQEFAGVVGVHEGLQGEAGALEAAFLDVVNGGIEEDFVGLLGVLGDRVLVLVAAAGGGHQEKRDHTEHGGMAKRMATDHRFTHP
jgi:hypothetical protein